jgi:DNA polymerase-3 subunit gamma/tau
MFDNLLFQDRLVEQLTREVTGKTLPASVLFHGPAYSAKLTAALETARGLSCLADGAWSCSCDHCRTHRTLDYPWLLLTGTKNLLPEIEAGSGLLERHRTEARRFFFLRAVRKLVKRFDTVLWEGEETRLKGTSGPLAALQDDLEGFYPPNQLPDEAEIATLLERIKESCQALSNALPSGGLPIHQVRKLSAWARTTTTGAPKFIIVENADKMLEGSRNALLKILEEPPAQTWFFLLTSQKGAMIPTILSRLRAFSFSGRTPEQEQKILASLFQAESGVWAGLGDYFQAFENQKKGLYDDLAQTFLAGLRLPVYPLDSYGKFWSQENNFPLFLEALAGRLQSEGPEARPLIVQERLFRLLQEVKFRRETYNLGPALLIETLFYKCRAVHPERSRGVPHETSEAGRLAP